MLLRGECAAEESHLISVEKQSRNCLCFYQNYIVGLDRTILGRGEIGLQYRMKLYQIELSNPFSTHWLL